MQSCIERIKAPTIIFVSITSIYAGLFICKRSDGSQAMAVLAGFGLLFTFIIYKVAHHSNRRAVVANATPEDTTQPTLTPAQVPAQVSAQVPAQAPDTKCPDTCSHNITEAPPSYDSVCRHMCVY